MSWFDQLQPASYRGIPFLVESDDGANGRRTALHEYPFRDDPYPEDMGRATRDIEIVGFLIGDDVIEQRIAMIAAAEQPGGGELVHPSLGRMTVSHREKMRHSMRWDKGRYCALRFTFVRTGQLIYPTVGVATGDAVIEAATTADAGANSDFVSGTASAVAQGAAVIGTGVSTLSAWGRLAVSLGSDATNLNNMVSGLPGNHGRYFNGSNVGVFGSGTSGVTNATATVGGLILEGVTALAAVGAATAALTGTVGSLGTTSTASDIAAAAQALAAALLASCANPADGIRLLSALADFGPAVLMPSSVQGQAMQTMQGACGDLCRRAAVVALARASTTYQPSSYDDAASVMDQVCGLLDGEITVAGDGGQDTTFSALRALRVTVVQDLTARGANLAPIQTFSFNSRMPALVLATRLYRDPSRADELVSHANPIHPLFMPLQFQALAS